MQLQTTFSIEGVTNPETGLPFGSKYAGVFSIRRPTLQDKTNIALKCVAELSVSGGTGINLINEEILNANYVFSQLAVISTTEIPEWFDKSKIYEEDEPAVEAVAKAVRDFVDSFRSKKTGGRGEPASQNTPVVVSPEVQYAAERPTVSGNN